MNAITKLSLDILYNISKGIYTSGFILCGVSLLTSTAISVGRLLALMLGLRYRHVVILSRVRATIILFWFILVSPTFPYLFANRSIFIYTASTTFGVLSLAISVFSYTKIVLRLRQNQAQVQGHAHQGQPNGRIPLNSHAGTRRRFQALHGCSWHWLFAIFRLLFSLLSTQTKCVEWIRISVGFQIALRQL